MQGKRFKMGGRRIRGLKMRVERECCISRGSQRGQIAEWRYTSWRNPKRKTRVGRCGIFKKTRDAARRVGPEMRAAQSFESRKGEK